MAHVNNCTFDCNDAQMPGTYSTFGLRPPMIGQRSAIAIAASDVNPLFIGSNAADANYFYNHDYGLMIKNVNITANYNTFKNIDDNSINSYNFNTPKGYSIHCENTNNGNYLVDFNYNEFSDGCSAIGAWNGYKGHFISNDIKTMSNFGIVFVENPKKDFRIFYNTIDNVGWVGIYGLNNFESAIGIHGNILNNSFDKLFRTAIGIDELVTASSSMPAYSIQINHNTINNYQYGITTTRITAPSIMSNTINIQQTPWALYAHGIRLYENYRADIIGNTIFGNSRDEWFVDGIRNDEGTQAKILCNYTVKTGSGAFFVGSSISNAQLHSNIFLKDFWGVVLAGQAKIGGQGNPAGNESFANQWWGSMGNPDYSHTYCWDALGQFSPFYTLTGYPWQPTIANNGNGGQSTTWAQVSNNQFDNCLLYRDSIDTNMVIISPVNDPINETQLLQQINSAQSSNYTAGQAWWLKASAYSRLEAEDYSAIQNFDLIMFKDSVDSAALGRFTNINRMLSDTIVDDIDSLRAANSDIGTNSNVELLLKIVNELNMLRIKNGKLGSEEIEQLRNVAALCPFDEGPAVFTARALLRGIDSLRQEYMNECEKVYPTSISYREGEQQIINNNIKPNVEEISLKPNPAKNNISITHNGIYSDMIVEEISGKLIFSQALNQSVNSEQIDISTLNNGLYIVKLTNENCNFIIKLIIKK